MRRGAVIVGGVGVLVAIVLLTVAVVGTGDPPQGSTVGGQVSPAPGGEDGGEALSSPLDPDARFFWELQEPPRSLIPLDEIISGGPPPNGIPAIDRPAFVSIAEASEWLQGNEPVVAFELNGDARAYPVQILIWHEIVNDVVAGQPVSITYCPLCNSAVVFSRRVNDLVLDFGTSGRLWKSDLVMYERQTKSLWPQIEGRAVVGPLIGEVLDVLPASTVAWDEWRQANADGRVLSRDTGFTRPYGANPYGGYDSPGSRPFLFGGDIDGRLDAVERVIAVELEGIAKAYAFTLLAEGAPRVVEDRIGTTDLVVFFELGTSSALDTGRIAEGRDVGASGVFLPRAGGQSLTFDVRDGSFVDRETGSRWNLLGKAVAGPLLGEALEALPHIDTFWFAWAAFQPDTVIWQP